MAKPRPRLAGTISYDLPANAIAQTPARPRDAAKLLVTDRHGRVVADAIFRNLAQYLPAGAVLVFNDTRVIPARIRLFRATGGRVELLITGQHGPTFTALVDRGLQSGDQLSSGGRPLAVFVSRHGKECTFRRLVPLSVWRRFLQRNGQTPLPPYLRHSPLTESARRTWYQAVFAAHDGSVAAPTASLHFTPALIQRLRQHGAATEYITLHVGLGTFAPLTAEHLRSGRLHQERGIISAAVANRLNEAKRAGRPIIAVGTTVARMLESATIGKKVVPGARQTEIFIRPGYKWKFVDGLITNFHVPDSSLLLLVAALVGRAGVQRLYHYALDHDYRFLSFGDGMVIV